MKNWMYIIISSVLFCTSSFAQSELTKDSFKKVGWQWDLGLGLRTSDVSLLNTALFANPDNKFNNTNVTFHYGLNAVIKNKISVGFEYSIFGLSNEGKENDKLLILAGGTFRLNAGAVIYENKAIRLTGRYGIGFDLYSLNVSNNTIAPVDFTQATNTFTSTALSSINFAQSLSLKLDFNTSNKTDEVRNVKSSFGVEVGYNVAGDNTWSNANFNEINGPNIDNNGLFFRIVYSSLRTKVKKP